MRSETDSFLRRRSFRAQAAPGGDRRCALIPRFFMKNRFFGGVKAASFHAAPVGFSVCRTLADAPRQRPTDGARIPEIAGILRTQRAQLIAAARTQAKAARSAQIGAENAFWHTKNLPNSFDCFQYTLLPSCYSGVVHLVNVIADWRRPHPPAHEGALPPAE